MSNEVNIEIDVQTAGAMIAAGKDEVAGERRAGSSFESGAGRPPLGMPEYDTETLFAGTREIIIHHAGAAYRMKITRQGKLILNK